MASSSIYVETRVRAPLDRLWAATQDPELHARWDVRFTSIRYEQPEQSEGRPRAYRYALRVLPGLVVAGTGVSAGERRRPDGTRTSALRYASSDPLSLIRAGSGWWRYVPQPDGSIRFLTGYDYRPGWGPLGRPVDLVFRPLLGWATAWSFDRLRGWLDDDVDPARALRLSLAGLGLRKDVPQKADWFTITAWQGGASVVEKLTRVEPGVYRTNKPVPVYGNWKSTIRYASGNNIEGVPIFFPRDDAIPAPEVRADPTFTRTFQLDKKLLQREQKPGVPKWLTWAAYLAVAALAGFMLAVIAWSLRTAAGRGRISGPRNPKPSRTAVRGSAVAGAQS